MWDHGWCPVAAHRRVAIVLRGEAFRGSTLPKARFDERLVTSCNVTFGQLQLRAWASLLSNVVRPLEDTCDVNVDLFAAECSGGCPLMWAFRELFSGPRVVHIHTSCKSASQGESLRESLSLFERCGEPSRYVFIVLARHDALWAVPIAHWSLNASRFHFLSQCQLRCVTLGAGDAAPWIPDGFSADPRLCHPSHGGPPSMCVHDIVHVIPGASFDTFSRTVVGTYGCFSTSSELLRAAQLERGSLQRLRLGGPMEGHQCYNATRAALPELPAFLLENWRPRSRFMREPTPLVSLMPLHDTHRAGHALPDRAPDVARLLNISRSLLHTPSTATRRSHDA